MKSYLLERLYDAPDQTREIGVRSQAWFHAHNGRGMAQRWLSELS